MPVTGNAGKALRAMQKQYGAARGKSIFYQTINKHRRRQPGSAFLRAIGSQEARGAASGGHGHARAKASPLRATNAPKSVKTAHPKKSKRS